MDDILRAISHRRAIKTFDPIEIPAALREQLLNAARLAPSSFNMQPYRLYWVESAETRKIAAKLCMGQAPAETASALVVAVADIGSGKSTMQSQLAWLRETGLSEKKLLEQEKKAKIAQWLVVQDWFGILCILKWTIFRLLNVWRTMGMPPVSRQGWFKWATKSTSLACENLMIAAEALRLNTCPMEGFDGRRLSKLLGLNSKYHEIVMVIAIGKKSSRYVDRGQWRRPLASTVTIL